MRRYDPPWDAGVLDWKLIYQSRVWVEKTLSQSREPLSLLEEEKATQLDRPAWKVSGRSFLSVIRDMLFENGIPFRCARANYKIGEMNCT
jgi:hypothetical protein